MSDTPNTQDVDVPPPPPPCPTVHAAIPPPPPPTLHVYRGWRSTKLHHALITQALLAGAFWLAGFPHDLFAMFCTAQLVLAGVYSGADLAQRFMSPKVP